MVELATPMNTTAMLINVRICPLCSGYKLRIKTVSDHAARVNVGDAFHGSNGMTKEYVYAILAASTSKSIDGGAPVRGGQALCC